MQQKVATTVLPNGHIVIDDDKHAKWREAYHRHTEMNKSHAAQQVQDALARYRQGGPLEILNTKQVAEYYDCCQGTAYQHMRTGVIPSFRIGSRWYTQSWVLDLIDERARLLFAKGFVKRSIPRMVYKYDLGEKW